MTDHFIDKKNFSVLVENLLKDAKVIAPVHDGVNFHLEEITADNASKVDLNGFRTIESFKSYLFKITEKVSRYFGADELPRSKKLIFLGMRACDLEALEVLDRVLTEGDFKYPHYEANSKEVLIIGADCTDCGKTCFCTTVKGKPCPSRGFDLNFSPLDDGYVVEVMTEKGKNLLNDNKGLFIPATDSQQEKKKENFERVVALIAQKNADYKLKSDLSETHKKNLENKCWRGLTKDCVECSACNFICPTCTCFLLLDERTKELKNERTKIWDACLKAGYARVAGGSNARGKLYERLQNRYHCKFDYSFDRLGRYTCVGCGRCIDGCAGSIDMRKIFVELERQAPLTAKLA